MPLLVGPAALALRAEMVAGRAGAAVEHRVAAAVRAAPEAAAASFRDLVHQAVGLADGGRRDARIGGGGETDCQRGTQRECPCHSLLCEFRNRFPEHDAEISGAVSLQTRKSIAPLPLATAWHRR